MLSCADFLAEFGDYLENVADPDLRARLEEHLRECKTYQVIVDSTKRTFPFKPCPLPACPSADLP
jgi:hypothetical protein